MNHTLLVSNASVDISPRHLPQLEGQRNKSMCPATETHKPSRRGIIEASGVDPSAGTGDHKTSPSEPPAGVCLGQNILDMFSACKFQLREASVLKTKVQRRTTNISVIFNSWQPSHGSNVPSQASPNHGGPSCRPTHLKHCRVYLHQEDFRHPKTGQPYVAPSYSSRTFFVHKPYQVQYLGTTKRERITTAFTTLLVFSSCPYSIRQIPPTSENWSRSTHTPPTPPPSALLRLLDLGEDLFQVARSVKPCPELIPGRDI